MDPNSAGQSLVLFDGVCNLCNGCVRWIVKRDRSAVFRFAPMQSGAARRALEAAGVPTASPQPDSIIVIDADGVHTRSDSAIAIARRLGFPWSLARVGRVLPRSVRDWLYDRVARNRYRLFGKAGTCMVPTPELRSRFLDE
ncbi:MAG: thiol-disulfide oxidoreductase DCC family protein [Phycisphaerales bacterium]|nr:thiol-disulfide oxidoreductase DCC family protein [Phycisphaerales bacterium]